MISSWLMKCLINQSFYLFLRNVRVFGCGCIKYMDVLLCKACTIILGHAWEPMCGQQEKKATL